MKKKKFFLFKEDYIFKIEFLEKFNEKYYGSYFFLEF